MTPKRTDFFRISFNIRKRTVPLIRTIYGTFSLALTSFEDSFFTVGTDAVLATDHTNFHLLNGLRNILETSS